MFCASTFCVYPEFGVWKKEELKMAPRFLSWAAPEKSDLFLTKRDTQWMEQIWRQSFKQVKFEYLLAEMGNQQVAE